METTDQPQKEKTKETKPLMPRKRQLNLYLDIALLEKIQKKAEKNYQKLNGYVTGLIIKDLKKTEESIA